MLDERKVKLMTQLALYDQTQGKEDFKISEYYRKDYDILTGKLPGSPEVYEATPTTLFHKCVLCYSSHGKIPSLHSGLVSHISGIAVHESLIFPQLSCTKGILPHDLPFHKKGR